VALTIAIAPGVRADEHDRLTYMTFSGPVQLPGVTLAAGTYTFKLADIETNRHIVQVFSKDDNKLITTLMTISNERLEPVKDTFVMFSERPSGSPVAVKAWFYPGRRIGEEFLYPRKQAVQIAKATHESVLSTEAETVDQSAKVGRVNEAGDLSNDQDSAGASASANRSADQSAANRSSDAAVAASTTRSTEHDQSQSTSNAPAASAPESTIAQNDANARTPIQSPRADVSAPTPVGTSGQAPASTSASDRPARLPRTASPLEFMELLTGLSLAGGFGVRYLRSRR